MTTPAPGRKRRRTSGRRAPGEHPPAEHPPAGQRPAGPPAAPPAERRPPAAPFPQGERFPAAGPYSPAAPYPAEQYPAAGHAPVEPAPAPAEPASAEPGTAERASGRRSSAMRSAKRSAKPSPRRDSAEEPEGILGRLEAWGLSPVQQKLVLGGAWTAAAAAVIGALLLAIAAIGNDYVPEPPAADTGTAASQPRPAAYRGWPSSKVFAPIAQSKADPLLLPLKDVFAEKTLTEGRITLRLTGTKLDVACAEAVWGRTLTDRLAQAGCTQALRGTYTSADRRYVAQYTLFKLRDAASADGLVSSLATLHRGGWVRPVDPARPLFTADGHSEGSGHAMGHYAGLVWIGRADGAEPDAKDDFVSLSLAVRGAEKAVFRRVVAVAPTP
ncbi:hypothetical protein Ppa06_05000 [Planomonospora parontospora subsp. parontospora]|uniref:Uncharacterized protein n=2 Tax=Planomonospora parontospora TaxID=58119 RepID=A0AA37F2D9_9ACTN|nr:hypothetical protein [Planomonospora parontospora]GGK48363.1 hypothetical protein GCM10010126_05010 [Planomonospora parontospora]GII06702.1 hypothetical protein Ppa06_05000 [Planomonospora parontospora subsp. parontospora]